MARRFVKGHFVKGHYKYRNLAIFICLTYHTGHVGNTPSKINDSAENDAETIDSMFRGGVGSD